MPFLTLSTVHFRNLADRTIDLLAREVYFVGENGQGKSNLLETLYCSAYGSSFRTRADTELIREGEDSMSVRSMFRDEGGATHTTVIMVRDGFKRIEKDGKMLRDRKELIDTMPCVLYNHDDLDFAAGSPERRRFFVDQSLSMHDVLYVDVLRRYKRILRSRNACLKDREDAMLPTYDIQLVMNGLEVQKKRKDAVFRFNQIFGRLYEEIAGIGGLSIRYSPSWHGAGGSLPDVDAALSQLRQRAEAERAVGSTLSGPHRDRITFMREGRPFVPTASTGQRRLAALVLRTAQANFYTQVTGRKPVLLMDDVLLELDPDKRARVTALLPDYDQLFCTFLPGEPYGRYRKEGTRVYLIRGGDWEEAE